jgi:hypothetical protein
VDIGAVKATGKLCELQCAAYDYATRARSTALFSTIIILRTMLFENVNKRSLNLGSASMASMIYLLDKYFVD